jgi:hypothetical protein
MEFNNDIVLRDYFGIGFFEMIGSAIVTFGYMFSTEPVEKGVSLFIAFIITY